MVQFLVEMQSRKLAKTTLKSATLQGAAWDWVGILQVLEVRINQPGTKEVHRLASRHFDNYQKKFLGVI